MNTFYIKVRQGKGRCVHAAVRYKKGTLIMTNPVITYPFMSEDSPLSEYSMAWSNTEDCLALGHINLLNHSDTPNCRIKDCMPEGTKLLYALRDIAINEELTVKYRCPLWFKPEEEQ